MTKLREIYKCDICGNVVELVSEGAGELVCCGQPMVKLEAKTEDAGKEKHVPVIEKTATGIKVKVGSIAHPMEEKHYIKFIEVLTSSRVCRAELKPSQAPEAEFKADLKEVLEVKEYCTIHSLWKAQI